ncbi:MAG: CoA-binding protein [Ignavibacterium sp.]|nr:CoA-binding protein [Ignavibacterium sp.]
MNSKKAIDNFLEQKNIAVIGVSSKGKGFGVAIYSHLKNNGYNVYGVNNNGGKIGNENLYKSLSEIPHKIESVITVVPPRETEKIVREIDSLGINQVWMQQGSESKSAIEFCVSKGMNVITSECIMMFAEPVRSIHSFHRWINKFLGKYPVN